jgi:hypothetical protein
MGKFPDGGALSSGGRTAVVSCTGTSAEWSLRSLLLLLLLLLLPDVTPPLDNFILIGFDMLAFQTKLLFPSIVMSDAIVPRVVVLFVFRGYSSNNVVATCCCVLHGSSFLVRSFNLFVRSLYLFPPIAPSPGSFGYYTKIILYIHHRHHQESIA